MKQFTLQAVEHFLGYFHTGGKTRRIADGMNKSVVRNENLAPPLHEEDIGADCQCMRP